MDQRKAIFTLKECNEMGSRQIGIHILLALFLILENVYAQKPEEEMLNKGRIYCEKEMYDEAISKFSVAIRINPLHVGAYLARGIAYLDKDDFDRAISDYNKAIEIAPDNSEAYFYRGIVYLKKDDLGQALLDYNKAIQIDSGYSAAYFNRAVIYFLKQEYDKSWEDVHKAESLGFKVYPGFLEELRKASGKGN